MSTVRPATLPDLDCACAAVRRAARLITQVFGHEMGNAIEPSQFSLLTALNRRPGCSQAILAEALGLDKTSLSRNLRLMNRNGWIELAKNLLHDDQADKRERGYRLTPSGERVLAAAHPGWQRAQRKLRAAMTPAQWADMQKVFGDIARIAHEVNRTQIESS